MKPDRNELRLEVTATREKLLHAVEEHTKNIMYLEQRLTEERAALELVEQQLKILNLCVRAYLPDSEPPLAGGPVEPIRRGGRNSKLRTLVLEQIQMSPGHSVTWITDEIGKLTDVFPSEPRILNALAYWEAKGEVVKREGERWWPTVTLSEGSQDTESEAE